MERSRSTPRDNILVGGAVRVIDARNHEPLPVPFQYAVIVLQTDDAIAVQQIAERLPHGAGDDPLVIARDVIDGRQRRQAREQGPQRREGRVLVGQVAGDRDEIGLRRADGVQQRRVLLAKDAAMQIGDLHNAQARKP